MADSNSPFEGEHFIDMASVRVEGDFGDEIGDANALGGGTYRSEDGEQSADDVDGRGLHRTPTVNEIRYFYTQGAFGKPVVNKPIKDAFKNGFKLTNDPTNNVADFLDEYVPKFKKAETKARRDGFSVVYFQLQDSNNASESPENVEGINRIRTITLDDLTDVSGVPREAYEEAYDERYDITDLSVTPNGCVVVDNLTHPDDGDLIGYSLDTSDYAKTNEPTFLHANRCQHVVWSPEVDGRVEDDTFGHIEGDSVLTPALTAMRAVNKGNWGMGQALFRYSAPLHVAETPADYGQDEFQQVNDQMHDLVMSSSVVMPPATELETHDSASDFDPEPFYDVLINCITAAAEITKSVLMGTQTGTVSGSETDIKNYFSTVERYRQTRLERYIHEAVKQASGWSNAIIPSFSLGFGIQWNPIFKIEGMDRAEGMVRLMTAATNAVDNYVMTPTEAREFIESEYAELDHNLDLDELTEDEKDEIDRTNLRQVGVTSGDNEPDTSGNPRSGQNGGGMKQGQTTDQNNPTS